MSGEEWKRRCLVRIRRKIAEAGIIRLRGLQRATHYERGPSGEGRILWYEALEELKKRKLLTVECDALEQWWVMLPHFLEAFRKDRGISSVTTL
jgi:hypothetical protein